MNSIAFPIAMVIITTGCRFTSMGLAERIHIPTRIASITKRTIQKPNIITRWMRTTWRRESRDIVLDKYDLNFIERALRDGIHELAVCPHCSRRREIADKVSDELEDMRKREANL